MPFGPHEYTQLHAITLAYALGALGLAAVGTLQRRRTYHFATAAVLLIPAIEWSTAVIFRSFRLLPNVWFETSDAAGFYYLWALLIVPVILLSWIGCAVAEHRPSVVDVAVILAVTSSWLGSLWPAALAAASI